MAKNKDPQPPTSQANSDGNPFARMASRAVSANFGRKAAAVVENKIARQDAARDKTKQRRREAAAVSRARARKGDGRELDADRREEAKPIRTRAERIEADRHRRRTKRPQREDRKLRRVFRDRHKRDLTREEEQAKAAAEKALETHGIRHHYRRLPKLAFFVGYMAGLDHNGALALAMLAAINMPAARKEQVLKAAFEPQAYQPRRNVCTKGRAGQTPFELGDRQLGGSAKLWEDGKRAEHHPGAVRVIQCACFLWLCRSRTSRRGYMGRVRGFGRGVFASMCRCGISAIADHENGMPGALVALKEAGFVQYGQPPAEVVGELDKGPSGHAYLMFWFPSTVAERALELVHQRMAELGKLPYVERLLAEPDLIEALTRAQAPPVVIDDSEIPY